MDDPRPLVNIGDLAKPADTLIVKMSDAIGGYFRPFQIRRIARAEAEAAKIRALADVEITEIQRRGIARLFMEEGKKQDNMESIARKALVEVTEEARPDLIEDDWITHFFDRCRLISDDDMQTLWARVLSGQANKPGSYSKKTVETLANLEKSDALLFTELCAFSVTFDKSYPLVYDLDHPIYISHNLNFETLYHLESLGIIHFNSLGYKIHGLNQAGVVSYFNAPILLEFAEGQEHTLQIGMVMLTQAGSQLQTICAPQPVDGFVDYLKQKWDSESRKSGLNVPPIIPQPFTP